LVYLSSNWVRCVAFKPDNPNILVSGSSDKTIKTWDITSGSCLSTLRGHRAQVTSVCFSPDGAKIVSGSLDKTVLIWDTASGEQLCSLSGHSSWVLSVAWSPDGTKLASGSRDETVRIWEAATGKQLWQLSGEKQINSVAFSPDGSLIAAGGGGLFEAGTIRLYNAATGDPFGSPLRGHTDVVRSVCFSSDGKELSGSDDSTVRNWDPATRASLS
jgi:WD40 repeat protein